MCGSKTLRWLDRYLEKIGCVITKLSIGMLTATVFLIAMTRAFESHWCNLQGFVNEAMYVCNGVFNLAASVSGKMCCSSSDLSIISSKLSVGGYVCTSVCCTLQGVVNAVMAFQISKLSTLTNPSSDHQKSAEMGTAQ